VHPDRVAVGIHPDRGLAVTAAVTAARPSGAGWEADVLVAGAAVTCRLPGRPEGATVSLTILDPPCFGPDGQALQSPADGGWTWHDLHVQ
jgi:hypothetical protein